MSLQLSAIPAELREGSSARFYVVHKTSSGGALAIHETDPKDDVLYWSQLGLARGAAKTYQALGGRVDAILRVESWGWTWFTTGLVDLPDDPDFGSW